MSTWRSHESCLTHTWAYKWGKLTDIYVCRRNWTARVRSVRPAATRIRVHLLPVNVSSFFFGHARVRVCVCVRVRIAVMYVCMYVCVYACMYVCTWTKKPFGAGNFAHSSDDKSTPDTPLFARVTWLFHMCCMLSNVLTQQTQKFSDARNCARFSDDESTPDTHELIRVTCPNTGNYVPIFWR